MEIIDTIKTAIPVILLIFICIISTILVARLIFIILLNKARKKYLLLKNKSKNIFQKKNKINPNKKDEEIFLEKKDNLEKNNQKNHENNISTKYEKMNPPQQEEQISIDDTQIVDIVKPIGFFTSMILGQKLTYLIQSAQIINKRGNKGFWVSMIEAQERAAGRQRGRGR